MLYDDGRIACGETGVIIRWYYPWGAKKIGYTAIRSVTARPLTHTTGQRRIWGSGDLTHWYNLDGSRSKKRVALEIDTGGRVRPTITPDDPDAVHRIVTEHLTR